MKASPVPVLISLGPNIRLRILFSNTLSPRSSLNIRDHVSQTYSPVLPVIIIIIIIIIVYQFVAIPGLGNGGTLHTEYLVININKRPACEAFSIIQSVSQWSNTSSLENWACISACYVFWFNNGNWLKMLI